jgi:hypothetical protein
MAKVKHVALPRGKPGVAAPQIAQVVADLGAPKRKLAGLLDLSRGANISGEGLHQGFGHGSS